MEIFVSDRIQVDLIVIICCVWGGVGCQHCVTGQLWLARVAHIEHHHLCLCVHVVILINFWCVYLAAVLWF